MNAGGCVPNTFIVGAPKCGTTALHSYLSQHPDVFMCKPKEPRFFGRESEWARELSFTWAEYMALFHSAQDFAVRGDASPTYFSSETAARDIKEASPESKIIVMLRDPVEMMSAMHSQVFFTADETEPSFAKALELESHRARGMKVPRLSGDRLRLLYRKMACYGTNLERYIRSHGQDNVHVIIFDDLKKSARDVHMGVLRFLGISELPLERYEIVNPARSLRSPFVRRALKLIAPNGREQQFMTGRYAPLARGLARHIWALERKWNVKYQRRAPVPAALAASLRSELRSEIQMLEHMIGRDLSSWYQAQ